MKRCVLACVFTLVLGSLPVDVAAQGMEFSLEDTGQKKPLAKLGKPSKLMKQALDAYQQKRYQDAALKFQRVVDRKSRDKRGNRQKAQFFLGKSLYHLRFYQSALNIFDEISSAGPRHLFFGDTLQWLAQLASQLPESAGITEKVGRYGVGALSEFKRPETKALYHRLLYLMGRNLYHRGEFQNAIDLFQEVDRASTPYLEAKFFEGVSFVRMRKARPAIASFRKILNAVEKQEYSAAVDVERMRNLAWISLARIYYTAANKVDLRTGDQEVDGILLGQAVESWDRVQQSSEYWLDALFESSWAFFLADEYSRALGNVHAIYSPFFPDAYYPEALVTKAVTFFVNCQVENAEAMVALFHKRFDPVKKELQKVLRKNRDNTAFFELLKKIRSDQADLSPTLRAVMSTAVDDREVLGHLEYVALLDAEEKRLGKKTKGFQDSKVGGRVLQDIAVARSFAVDQTGDLTRARYRRLIRELDELRNQVDTVELEIATFQRGQIDQELQQQLTEVSKTRGGDVVVDEEHQLWPFDGEYWRDELGFYRQQVTNRCVR